MRCPVPYIQLARQADAWLTNLRRALVSSMRDVGDKARVNALPAISSGVVP
jgi:hypothetical protein